MNTRVSDDEFAGQAVLVTGGASGMGWAACERFAARGAAILIADTDTVSGPARAADLQARGARAAYFECDVGDPAACEGAVAETLRRF